jgi:hypothetical protein
MSVQAAGRSKFSVEINRRHRMTCRQCHDLITPTEEEWVGADEESIAMPPAERPEGDVDLALRAGLRYMKVHPFLTAASRTSRVIGAVFGLVGFTSSSITPARGISSETSSSRFGCSSTRRKLTPVRLPLGRPRLPTSLVATGSPPLIKTIGIVALADFAASQADRRAVHTRHPMNHGKVNEIREALSRLPMPILNFDIARSWTNWLI